MADNSDILQEISDAKKKEQSKSAEAPVAEKAEKPAAASKQRGAPAPVAEKPAPEK